MTDVRAEALRGPWRAVLAWRDGWVITWEEFTGGSDDPAEVRIQIVRGTAAPTEQFVPGDLRLAGTYNGADLLVDWDGEDCDDMAALEARWIQAQAMVAGLNAAEDVSGA